MKAIEILMNEHDLIRQFLENLALAVSRMEGEDNPPKEFFEKANEFARLFADQYHHFKEEYVMFVQLAQKKGGVFDAQIDALRYQHERGRNFLAEISKSLSGYAQGQPIPTTTVLENTAAYLSLLRQHIHREDHIFYPLVEKEFSQSDDQRLLEEFRKAEERCGGKVFERSRRLLMEMGAMLEERGQDAPLPASAPPGESHSYRPLHK